MGLAASQARLISLQARMSDTEYEGQQINQQRQVLANKMNEVYNKSIDMEVPVPPSKIDFAYKNAYVYEGITGKDAIHFRLNEDTGNLVAYRKTEDYNGLKDISVTLTASDFYKPNEGAVIPLKTLEGATLDANGVLQADYELKDGETFYDKNGNEITPIKEYPASEDRYNAIRVVTDKDGNEQQISRKANGEWGPLTNGEKTNFTNDLMSDNPPQPKRIIPKNTALYIRDTNKTVPSETNFIGSIEEVGNRLETSDDPKLKKLVDKFKKIKDAIPKEDQGKYTVVVLNGNIYVTESSKEDVEKDINSDDSKDNVALKQWGLIQGQETVEEEEISLDDCVISENGTILQIHYVSPDGVEHDYKVKAEGDAYNEVEYDKAYCEYEAEKVEYDRKQNELNKTTSIYQRQDKQLELKLTRLDNERNALNTEIDAVKKVIQDATEKGFKTFSG